MGLFSDSVPRDLYDTLQKRYDDLMDKYHSLRMNGYDPAAKIRVIPPKPDSGLEAMHAIDRAATDPRIVKAAERFIAEGLPDADAWREASRLVGIGTGRRAADTTMDAL